MEKFIKSIEIKESKLIEYDDKSMEKLSNKIAVKDGKHWVIENKGTIFRNSKKKECIRDYLTSQGYVSRETKQNKSPNKIQARA